MLNLLIENKMKVELTLYKNSREPIGEIDKSWINSDFKCSLENIDEFELKIPKFVEEFSNYLIAIRNLSEVYIKNMTVTIEQFLEFINVHKFKNRYNSITKMTLNDIRGLNNSDIYSFIFFLAESHYKNNSRVVKIEHLRTFFDYLFRIEHKIFREPFKKINSERKIEKKLPRTGC